MINNISNLIIITLMKLFMMILFTVILFTTTLFAQSASSENRKSIQSNNQKAKASNIVVMDYHDFGPPSMSFELLGQSWWRWETSGSPDPSDKYSIKVVVYSNLTLAYINSKYPILPDRKQDYRYVIVNQAIQYLNKNIEDNILPEVTEKLERTKLFLTTKFDK